MLFVKVENGVAKGIPISYKRIIELNPNISFPKSFSSSDVELIEELGYEPVPHNNEDDLLKPTANVNEVVVITTPENVDGVWRRRYTIRKRSISEISKRLQRVRALRDDFLRSSDWVELPSVRANKSAEWCTAWDNYRQALRDITNTDDIFNITFPTRPL